MAAGKKPHLRKCIGCGSMKEKQDLIRVIRTEAGEVLIDEAMKGNGRGAYVCRSVSCVETAGKRRSLERALKCSVDRSIYEQILEMAKPGL